MHGEKNPSITIPKSQVSLYHSGGIRCSVILISIFQVNKKILNESNR